MRNGILGMGLRLLLITVIAGLVLGGTYALTKDAIREQDIAKAEAARRQVLPEAESFEEIEPLSEDIAEIYEGFAGGESKGYALTVNANGYGGRDSLKLSVGIGNDGVIKAISIITNSETAGLGARASEESFYGQYAGIDSSADARIKADGGKIDAISAATVTSRAVSGAVEKAMDYYAEHLKGEER